MFLLIAVLNITTIQNQYYAFFQALPTKNKMVQVLIKNITLAFSNQHQI